MPTCPLTLRLVKGSKLTFAELDQNFVSLRNCINTVNSNFINYLPLSGGTLTGPLTACTSGIYINDLYSCNNDLTVWSNVTIEGNVTINGSATTINTEVIQAQDNVIILNYSGNSTTADGGGMVVVDAQGTGVPSSITVDSNGLWVFDPGFSASTATVDSLTACTGIWTSNLYGCSPITIHDNIQSIGSSATGTTSFAFGNNVKAYGNYSTASGYYNLASGNYSHAEGYYTTASGQGAHTEGYDTTASAYYSHAEGRNTTSSGYYSHAEGYQTQATGSSSHAEGRLTKAYGQYSHAEGQLSVATGIVSHAEGYQTTAIGSQAHSEGFTTIASGGSSHAEGELTKAIGETSHSEGYITSAVGDYSHSEGVYSISIGNGSHAEGSTTTASGIYSHAEGSQTTTFGDVSHSEGELTTAVGYSSHSEGYNTRSVGNQSHTEGNSTTTFGDYSHSEGVLTISIGVASHSEGQSTIASGASSHAEGYLTTASGIYSHAEGSNTTASGTYSHAEGGYTTASGNYGSHAEGNSTTAIGEISHAEGVATISIGGASHSEGDSTTSIGSYSHSEGRGTRSIGNYSHSEGNTTIANGEGSHSEGLLTTAQSIYSHSEGRNTTASGAYSHAEGYGTVTNGNYQHVQGLWNVTGDTTQGAFILGNGSNTSNRSNLIFAAGNQVNISGKTITTNFQMTSGGTNGYVLTSDALGNASWLPTGTNLGNILFVSNNGDDNTAVKGDLHRPYENIYTAKSAATAGDIIYVLPGTWVYDNRNSAGNPFNGQIETKVNLWKDGVNYYFLPGSKIVFYNQTSTGQVMYLFSPAGTIGETCNVYGDLEWEGNSTGPDTSNGHSTFFWLDNSNDSGFTFHAEFKKLTSYANEVIRVARNVTLTDSYPANITLIGDEIYRQYLGGQSGAAAVEFYNGSGDAILNLVSDIKKRSNIGSYWYFQFYGNLTRSSVNIFGDYLKSTSTSRTFWMRVLTGAINIDIKKIYHGTGHVFDTNGSGGWTLNLKGDIIDNVKNGSSLNGVFWITSSNNTINYDGNINTNIGVGNGRFIAGGTSNNTYNIKGDITYLGTGTTTNVMFYPQNGGTVNYSGKITGNYAGAVAQTLNGTVNINNSYIKSTVQNSSSRLFFNGTTSQGYFRLNNSYVELKNDTNALSNGSYINAFINNSIIINTGTGDTLSNTTNFGNLQVLNSTVTSSNVSTSIVSSGTAPVISSNSTVNTPYSITDLRGNITILTDLIY